MTKHITKLWFVACLAALWLVYGQVADQPPLSGPPGPTVTCGEQSVSIGAWSAHWTSPATSFVACGDVPTDPYVRKSLKVFTAKPGDTLTISFPYVPSRLKVTFQADGKNRGTVLYEGRGKLELPITLSDRCGGVYEVYTEWGLTTLGSGSAACGFLVLDETQPPVLTVLGEGQGVSAWRGSCQWQRPVGGGVMEGVSSDSPHPVDGAESLPVLYTQPGERVELYCDWEPDSLEVWVYPNASQDLGRVVPLEVSVHDEGADYLLVLPEDCGGAVFEVRGTWQGASPTDAGGQVSYAFRTEQ